MGRVVDTPDARILGLADISRVAAGATTGGPAGETTGAIEAAELLLAQEGFSFRDVARTVVPPAATSSGGTAPSTAPATPRSVAWGSSGPTVTARSRPAPASGAGTRVAVGARSTSIAARANGGHAVRDDAAAQPSAERGHGVRVRVRPRHVAHLRRRPVPVRLGHGVHRRPRGHRARRGLRGAGAAHHRRHPGSARGRGRVAGDIGRPWRSSRTPPTPTVSSASRSGPGSTACPGHCRRGRLPRQPPRGDRGHGRGPGARRARPGGEGTSRRPRA